MVQNADNEDTQIAKLEAKVSEHAAAERSASTRSDLALFVLPFAFVFISMNIFHVGLRRARSRQTSKLFLLFGTVTTNNLFLLPWWLLELQKVTVCFFCVSSGCTKQKRSWRMLMRLFLGHRKRSKRLNETILRVLQDSRTC